MAFTIPILNRARKWGYIIWKQKRDPDIKKLLNDADEILVNFEGQDLGKKRIDWKYRRISFGWRYTRKIPLNEKCYVLEISRGKGLSVKCQ
ncbi:MAG: hypothetical protein PHS66_01560 [Candidatus Omnitrophica bacterium]|nr:hypothetical protein [Candidatus Omnitrophota bacterium]